MPRSVHVSPAGNPRTVSDEFALVFAPMRGDISPTIVMPWLTVPEV